MKDRIRELLAYSFLDHDQVIPYINLTAREQSIITEDEYEEVIMFIRGEIDLYSAPIKKTKMPLWIPILVAFLTSLAYGIVYHLIVN
jgi:hypothetical protein